MRFGARRQCSLCGVALEWGGQASGGVGRLWRTIKYEEVYLRAYDSVCEAHTSLGRYIDFDNRRRPHSSLDRQTPDEAYFNQLSLPVAT